MSGELLTVKKVGQPTLRITRTALPQHIKLGWAHVEDEPEPSKAKPDAAKSETIKLKA